MSGVASRLRHLRRYGIVQRALEVRTNARDFFNSYVRGTTPARRTPFGFLLLGSHSTHHVAMQSGQFEPIETKLLLRRLDESSVFVDVGANIGFYSCLARSRGKRVVAVEPLAANLQHLYANLSANGWGDVEVFPMCAAGAPGIGELFGASSTGASLLTRWARASPRIHRPVALSTLDILLGQRFDGERLLVKVDVEGAEFDVLRGARMTLNMRPAPIWLVEIALGEFHPSGVNPNFRATFELFWSRGYRSSTAESSPRTVRQIDVDRWVANGRTEDGVINYVFERPT